MDSVTEGGPASAQRRPEPDRGEHSGSPFHLLFVCTGNTCRSPMASGLAIDMLEERGLDTVEVRSAGVAAFAGSLASGGAVRTAQRYGIDLTAHRSALLTHELVEWADLILTMSDGHVTAVEALGGGGKADLITRFGLPNGHLPGPGQQPDYELRCEGVLDPIGGDDGVYKATFEQLKELVERALNHLEGR